MKRLIQYYDSKKSNKLSLEDLAIYLYHAQLSHIEMFGDGNYAIYMDVEAKTRWKHWVLSTIVLNTTSNH